MVSLTRLRWNWLALVAWLVVSLLSAAEPATTHWAFQPLHVIAPPMVKNTAAVRNEIDRFILAKLEQEGLTPSPEADARTLIRRASFDLTGLPPEAEAVQRFTSSSYAELINHLLASPHYGEQWARHWLDIARYSDTKGYVYAREEKRWVHASAYRDWVVRSFNADLPYDRFLKLQIAADQLVPANSPDLAAMGFLTIGRRFLGVQHDIIDDRIDVLMRGTQALTVACARCHDHKYDPISTRDYYSLYGVFQSSAETLVPCSSSHDAKLDKLIQANHDLRMKRCQEQMKRTRDRLADYLAAQSELSKYPAEGFDQIIDAGDLNPFIVHRFANWLRKHALTADQFKALPAAERERLLNAPDSPVLVPDEHIANIETSFPTGVITELWKSQGELDRYLLQNPSTPAFATVLQDRAVPSTPRVFLRGNPLTKGDEVPRQFLPVLTHNASQPFAVGSGRLELANAIADAKNPLTARVIVNRVWQHHFGRGLVTTESDFGKRADPPTHPELLDWLAQKFIDNGWSLKWLHREIMLSATYRQGSEERSAKSEEVVRTSTAGSEGEPLRVSNSKQPSTTSTPFAPSSSLNDPDNRLLARMSAHRLSFEEARDAWLAASGQLDLRVGGKPVPLFGAENRRTVYGMIDRESVPPVLRTFDFANPDLSIAHRSETTVPQQALFGMNHPFVVTQAKALLKRAEIRGADDTERVCLIYRRLFQREPRADEVTSALDYVHQAAPAPVIVSTAKDWRYGYGEWDSSTGRIKSFTPLPHFTGDAWQGDDAWPSTKLGWAQLTATGGHPGNDRQHAVVRRWTAPADGSYTIASKLIHEPKVSDGIRGFVSHSREGKLRAVELLGSSADISFTSLHFKAGDTLDFVVDINRQLNSDQFLWSPVITREATAGSGGDEAAIRWDAKSDFAATPRAKLNGWEQFTQVLMLSNEFMFVD